MGVAADKLLGALPVSAYMSEARVMGISLSLSYLGVEHPSDYCSVTGLDCWQWGVVGGSALAGCLFGGGVGSVAPIIGTGIGCAAGASAGAAIAFFGLAGYTGGGPSCSGCQSELDQTSADFQTILTVTDTLAGFSAELLQGTQYYWYRLADIAAEEQVNSSTFSQQRDLVQSGILTQMAGLMASVQLLQTGLMTDANQFAADNGAPSPCAAADSNGVCPVVPEVANNPQSLTPYGYWVPSNRVSLLSTQVSTGTLSRISDGATTSCQTAGSAEYLCDLSAPPGYDVLTSTGPDVGMFPELPVCDSTVCPSLSASAKYYNSPSGATLGLSGPLEIVYEGNTYTADMTPHVSAANTTALWDELATLQRAAVKDGQVWWNLLRVSGWTNVSEIPPQYVIPYPWQSLPPNFNYSALNVYQIENLTYAWMYGMAQYFDSANYRGNVPCGGSVGCYPVNLNVQAKADVFMAGAPLSDYGQLAKWSLQGVTIDMWPQTYTVTTPLDTVQLLPFDNVMDMMVQGNLSVSPYELRGTGATGGTNGTSGGFPANSGDGAAIYLTSCTMNGVPENPCVWQGLSMNFTTGTVTGCTGVCSISGTGAPCFSSLVAFEAGFADPIGDVGGLACSIIVIVVSGVAMYFAVAIMRRAVEKNNA
jgi:hypothetical protein